MMRSELMRPSLTPAEEAVPSEVIHAVHVELARHEVVQEPFGVVVIENLDGRVECPLNASLRRVMMSALISS